MAKSRQDQNMSFGVPTDEAMRICKDIYRNEIVKVTVQISRPTVTLVRIVNSLITTTIFRQIYSLIQIKKDVKVSFSDQLGVIGNEYTYMYKWLL